MTEYAPIHELRAELEAARLQAVEELASNVGALPADALQKLAVLQTALKGVEDEIKAHEVKLGGGAEVPLK
jgi:hypothetical protein